MTVLASRGRRRETARRRVAFAGRLIAATALLVAAVAAAGCGGGSIAGNANGLEPLIGTWRGVLTSAGGELPFGMRVEPGGALPPGVVINGAAESPFDVVERQGAGSYRFAFVAAGSEIVGKLAPDGNTLTGFWRHADSALRMPFVAARADDRRFQRNDPHIEVASPAGVAALASIAGRWRIETAGEAVGPEPWELRQEGERVTVPVPGDDLTLEGIYRDGLLRLSSFDGRRAVLIHARATPEGRLQGDQWVAGQRAAEWEAWRVER